MQSRTLIAALVAAGLAGCGAPALKAAGESCTASSECGDGLVCDHGHSPPICAGTLTVDAAEIDAPPVDAAPVDARTDAAVIDARVDAPIDAQTDATDAETDAPTDAPPDA